MNLLVLMVLSFLAPAQDSSVKTRFYNTLDVAVNVSTLNSHGEDLFVINISAGSDGELWGADNQRFNVWHSQTQILLGSFNISTQRQAFTLTSRSLHAGLPSGSPADIVMIFAIGGLFALEGMIFLLKRVAVRWRVVSK